MVDKVSLFGNDLFGEEIKPVTGSVLKDKFLMPPFTVLKTYDGLWQDRKQAWLGLGIKGDGITREGTLGLNSAELSIHRYSGEKLSDALMESTSIFDPVLCEIMYTWFCPPGGQIVDPFAGGSVRGLIASLCGFKYWGLDLRPEQIAVNNERAKAVLREGERAPEWVVGDAVSSLSLAPSADLIFTCPPYGDLERYSDNPKDLSTMTYGEFLRAYGIIIADACKILKPNRFAIFVVGDFRDKTGFLRCFPAATIDAFAAAKVWLYNDGILLTALGTLPYRVTKQFEAGKKLGRSHQEILIFYKGDPSKIREEFAGLS